MLDFLDRHGRPTGRRFICARGERACGTDNHTLDAGSWLTRQALPRRQAKVA
jgi:hypothetical protein